MCKSISADNLTKFARPDETLLDALLHEEIGKNDAKIVVLDDDPTGIQTVHDVYVYTDWSTGSLRDGFSRPEKIFYILTNSRGVPSVGSEAPHREIAARLRQVSDETETPFLLVSRSDSPLRGHYLLETETLREELAFHGADFDGEILCFFFKEGGRFTIDNVHYVQHGDQLIPAGLTEFARDKSFGYSSSDLRDYVEEKTHGQTKAEDAIIIGLDSLQRMDFQEIEEHLMAARNFSRIVVNAVDDCDLKVFCIALYRVLSKGKRFLYRTAASFVKVLAGIEDRPLLSGEELRDCQNKNGGLIIVGSHVGKTSRQLQYLRKHIPDMLFFGI